jgi:hypothetical protein
MNMRKRFVMAWDTSALESEFISNELPQREASSNPRFHLPVIANRFWQSLPSRDKEKGDGR